MIGKNPGSSDPFFFLYFPRNFDPPSGAGVLLFDQKFGCTDKVIEHVLFALARPTLVPFLTVLAATANVGDGHHPVEVLYFYDSIKCNILYNL